MVITGRAALVALLSVPMAAGLVAAGLSGGVALLALNLVLLVVLTVDALLAADPRAVQLTRSGDRRIRLGTTALVRLRLRNTGSRRLRGIVRDAWTPTSGATIGGTGGPGRRATDPPADDRAATGRAATDRAPVSLAPGASTTLDIHVHPTRRGDRPTDRVTVRSLGPLGLAGRQRSLRADWSVRTLPEFAARRHLPSRLARLRDLDGRQAIAVRAQGTEFDSLREYVPGDDVRSIDWRATARTSDVMLRTWRPERDRQVVIVLDSGRTSAGRIGDETRLDLHLDAALLLATLAARAGDRVEVIAHDRATRLQLTTGGGPRVLPALVDGLALLEPELTETDHRGLVAAVLRQVRKRALVVVLTSLDRAPVEEGLLPALPVLAARHTVVIAAVRDLDEPEIGADVAGAYQHASQARAALDRAAVSAALSRTGARVVDAGPEEIAPALADAYLDLKARGQL